MSRNTHQKRHQKRSGEQNTELIVKEEGQDYGTILKVLGNSRFEIQCVDSVTRIGHVRGTMRKSVWINQGDIVLVSLRDYQDSKCDIIHRYSPEDARRLKMKGELPDIIDADNAGDAEDDLPFDFGEL